MDAFSGIRQAALPMLLLGCAVPALGAQVYYRESQRFSAPGNVVQLVYSEQYNKLIVRNAGSAIRIIDLATKTVSAPILSQWSFSDIDLTPDGRYLFAADYGGENIGYGTPANPHWVTRIDLANGSYQTKMTAAVAGRIEAVSAEYFILASLDQWITFTYNSWGTTNVTNIDVGPYYASAYYGNMEYDPNSSRLLHGNSGSSSHEIIAYRFNGTVFARQESTGTYGSAQGFGPTVALSQDQDALYYGRLKVEALDVTNNLKVFAEPIYAATADFAFGKAFYYDAASGLPIDSIGIQTTVFALGATEPELWAFDDATDTLRMFTPRVQSNLALLLQRLGPAARRTLMIESGELDAAQLPEDPFAQWSEATTFTVSGVPEPSVWILLLSALPLLCWAAHRRRLLVCMN